VGKLLDWLKRAGGKDETELSVAVDADFESHRQEVEGVGRKIVVKKGSTINIDNSTQNINISLSDIPTDKNEKEDLIGELKRAFDAGEIRFVSEAAASDIQDYNSNPVGDEVEAGMSYIAELASKQDILYMRTGLYVRSLNERGKTEDAKRIKDNASRTARARNIINLASAGFIEGYIVPICRAGGDDAKKIYDEIVEKMPGTVFVNAGMGVQETMNIIEEKIRNRELYHWEVDTISVNGLNKCVRTIESVRENIRKKYPNLKMSHTMNESSGLISAELKIMLE